LGSPLYSPTLPVQPLVVLAPFDPYAQLQT